MSKAQDIATSLEALGLKLTESDAELAKWCEVLARANLLGRGEPSPIAIEFVVRSIIDAGRIMGAAQLKRRQDAHLAQEEERVAEFINHNRKNQDPEGLNN